MPGGGAAADRPAIEDTEAKYGPGRRALDGEIKARAYQWKKNGIDTLDSAEAYLKKQDYFRSREGELPGGGDHRPGGHGGESITCTSGPSGASAPRRSIWPTSAPCCGPAA